MASPSDSASSSSSSLSSSSFPSKQAPIKISKSDFERAYKKVQAFQHLLARGKTPIQIVDDLLRMMEINHDSAWRCNVCRTAIKY